MTNQPQNEPSMEEILASIRRIISDEPQADAPVEEASASPMDDADDVFELTPAMQASPHVEPEPTPSAPVSNDDLDALFGESSSAPVVEEEQQAEAAPEPTFAPVPRYDAEPELVMNEAPLMSPQTEAAASAALAGLLSSNLMGQSRFEGNTVEGLVRELLRPMLRQWMDENLPTLVERLVEAEIERLARRGR